MTIFFTRSSSREARNDSVRVSKRLDDEQLCSDSLERIPGRIFNEGEHGVYIEIDHALEPGTKVNIEMVPPGVDIRKTAYKVHRGKIIWCRKIETGREDHYGAGIEIFEKVVQAEIPVLSLV